MVDQASANADAYRAGRDPYLNDPEGTHTKNPYNPLSSMFDHFERGRKEEAEKY